MSKNGPKVLLHRGPGIFEIIKFNQVLGLLAKRCNVGPTIVDVVAESDLQH